MCYLLSPLHFPLRNHPFLLLLLLLVHLGNLCHLLLQHRNLLRELFILLLLVGIFELEQLLMQSVDLLAQLIVLPLELTDHGLRHRHLR